MIFENLVQRITDETAGKDPAEYLIENITLARRFYRMNDFDAVFDDLHSCIVVLPRSYGFAYFQGESMLDTRALVGADARELVRDDTKPLSVRVTLLDALYGTKNSGGRRGELAGTKTQKAHERAKILLSGARPSDRVLLLGAVSDILGVAAERSLHVRAIDLEPQKIGRVIHGIRIEDGRRGDGTLGAIRESDYVIATGMIFSTGTADAVFSAAASAGARLVLYMETGAQFGGDLISFGAHAVFAERFPFYTLPGTTEYFLYGSL